MALKWGTIPYSWIAVTGGILSARVLLALLERIQQRGIDPKDLPRVTEEWREMQAEKARRRRPRKRT